MFLLEQALQAQTQDQIQALQAWAQIQTFWARAQTQDQIQTLQAQTQILKFLNQVQSSQSQIWAIQVHNITNPMCSMCKDFFSCKSPYFITINEKGYFVTQDYIDLYKYALLDNDRWKMFLRTKLNSILNARRTLENCYKNFLRVRKIKDIKENRILFHNMVIPQSFSDILRRFAQIPFIISTHSSKHNAGDDIVSYDETLTFKFQLGRQL